MAALAEEVKGFIVQRLACYDTPTRVAEAVREQFNVTIDRRQVEKYDAERAGKKPSAKWRAVFETTRKGFLDEASRVPIAHKAVRLHRLQRMCDRAEDTGNLVLARELLEQAAKEMGDWFTNRRVLSPEDPAEALARELGMSAEALRALAAAGPDDGTGDGHGDAE